MSTITRYWIMAGLLGLLVACGGGGGGDRAAGVEPGPEAPGQPVPPPPPVVPEASPYAEAEELLAHITSVTIPDDGHPVVEWQLTDGQGVAILDLEIGNVRFTLAKLQGSELGNLTGTWQSYINSIEEAGSVGPGTEDKLQATYEREEEGFTNNGDGTYRYRMAINVNEPDEEILAQAEAEGLDLGYEPDRTHRVAMQFDGNDNTTANPHYDWVPATGATGNIFTMDIAATENCNRCHDPLGIHGGNRREIEYCVTCHNAGSTDANSGNTVDLKVMVHKIHMGRGLPSVQEGGEYAIWGFRDSKHDYSQLAYPQDIRNCVNCHAGSATGEDRDDLTLTSQGDNWSQVPSEAVCTSCHENATGHTGRYEDTQCASCHSANGIAGTIEESHRILVAEAQARFKAQVLGVSNSMPGEVPSVTYRITDPETGDAYDLLNDPVFAGASINVRMAWDTRDYTNTGNGEENASSVATSALSGVTDNGDGSYTATMPIAIPDGSEEPGIAATGSGAAVIEGRLSIELEEGEEAERVPLTNAHAFFSIDEPDGEAQGRREDRPVVSLDNCLACHGTLSLHGNNRTDNIDSCVTCHNPRNTDLVVRELEDCEQPPDGKREESIDFKRMVHGIHAAAIRENPLTIVGFQCRTTYVYDEEHVHYPGDLSNCTTCHTDDGYLLPLADGVLGTTVDTGDDPADPTDDTVVTPVSSVCSSCHDSTEARAHMTSNGGNFATTQAAIDDGEVVEQCSVCHSPGSIADIAKFHNIHAKPIQ